MSSVSGPSSCTAFEGSRAVATGDLKGVAAAVKEVLDQRATERSVDPAALPAVLIFDDSTGAVVEVDFRGTAKQVLARLGETPVAPVSNGTDELEARDESAGRGRGRPKLGVVAREVTLLPRHWEWLGSQPGGASVALRKLVEEARRVNADRDRQRISREAAYRFMSVMAGNEPGFEEATRALFAGDANGFRERTKKWPADVRGHSRRMAMAGFEGGEPA
jgi:uncharacterized protein